eukprot:TRINITY_DN30598_c0_g1_i1.p1 TRINITY_DN30598_c0_g1~~TRINITY_DN30598_c0_g1_i1.p1  ORF type:complete len:425 (+),score=53.84 TRINITY_DN30598_c0_g1_i1:18-1292(+)
MLPATVCMFLYLFAMLASASTVDPTALGFLKTKDPSSVLISGDIMYIADVSGLIVATTGPDDIKVNGSVPIPSATSVGIDGRYACVVSAYGLSVVDMKDPNNPTATAHLKIDSAIHVTMDNTLAFVSAQGKGLVIVDVTVPAKPYIAGSLPVLHAVDTFMVGTKAYVANYRDGFVVMDTSDASHPTIIAKYDDKEFEYVQQVVVSGNYAYVCEQTYGVFIVDLTDLTNMKIVSKFAASNANRIAVRKGVLYIAAFGKGLYWVDVTDPLNPMMIGLFLGNTEDIFMSGDYIGYVALGDDGIQALHFPPLSAAPSPSPGSSLVPMPQTDSPTSTPGTPGPSGSDGFPLVLLIIICASGVLLVVGICFLFRKKIRSKLPVGDHSNLLADKIYNPENPNLMTAEEMMLAEEELVVASGDKEDEVMLAE